MSRPRSARGAAAEVVRRVLDEGAWVGPALDAVLAESGLDERDRALCTELARGTLRWVQPLEESLRRAQDKPKKLDSRVRPHLLVAAYQLQHLEERIPARAAVNEAVREVKRVRAPLAGFANAVLRNLGSALHAQLRPSSPLDEMARAFGIPLELAEAVTQGVAPEERVRALAALKDRPPLSLFARRPEELAVRLAEAGLAVERHPFVPQVLLLEGAGDVRRLPGFAEGELLVMDAGSALVAGLAGVRAGEQVLDLCAAPGSKSAVLQLAAGEGGRVVAVEQHESRARKIKENADRLGLDLDLVVADARERAPLEDKAPPGGFDAVLVDAPCSAWGTTRRRPEVVLRERSPEERRALLETQAALLAAGARWVRPGGRLVYAVCTPLPEEGAGQVAVFLEGHPTFERASARDAVPSLPDSALDDDGAVRLATFRHQADGFYAAVLRRRA